MLYDGLTLSGYSPTSNLTSGPILLVRAKALSVSGLDLLALRKIIVSITLEGELRNDRGEVIGVGYAKVDKHRYRATAFEGELKSVYRKALKEAVGNIIQQLLRSR